MICCKNCQWWLKPSEDFGECHGAAPSTLPNNINRTPVWTRTRDTDVCAAFVQRPEPVVVKPVEVVEAPQVVMKPKKKRR